MGGLVWVLYNGVTCARFRIKSNNWGRRYITRTVIRHSLCIRSAIYTD